jgi:hypothetical protein
LLKPLRQYCLWLVVSSVALLCLPFSAGAQQFRPYAEAKISEAQWQSYYSEVSTNFAKTLRDLASENLQLFFNEATYVTYTFTKPGHPAHPAWITRLVVAAGDKVTVSQLGFYAGSEVEYQKLFDSFNVLNERLKNSLITKDN